MAEQEEYASDQLKHDARRGVEPYPQRSTNAHDSRRSRGKGARTSGFEVDPAKFVELTPQQRVAAVRALTELLAHHLDHGDER
ncbi:hypothetical protein [Nocardiopsis nanhaiensis]